MSWIKELLRKQGQLMLKNDMYALFNVSILAMLPYGGWMAASVVALITLRKGFKKGSMLLAIAILANFFILNKTLPSNVAMIESILSYTPCFLAAGILYLTQSWRIVSSVLFAVVLIVMSLLQLLLPDFIMQQYLYIREVLNQLQIGNVFSILNANSNSAEQAIFANYFLGVQAAGVLLSAFISLVFARFIQSVIYYPEGFKSEILSLRGTKMGLLTLLITILAAKQPYFLAINMLPVLLMFFFIAGSSLWAHCITNKSIFIPMLVLSGVLVFFPHIMLLLITLLGSLDTLFNFRIYLQKKAGQTIREVK